MSSTIKPIKSSDLTPEQLASAEDFLSRNNWTNTEPTRTIPLAEVVRLIAWYGALRFQAGANGIGTLEQPPRLIQTAQPPPPPVEITPPSDFEIINVEFIPLNS